MLVLCKYENNLGQDSSIMIESAHRKSLEKDFARACSTQSEQWDALKETRGEAPPWVQAKKARMLWFLPQKWSYFETDEDKRVRNTKANSGLATRE